MSGYEMRSSNGGISIYEANDSLTATARLRNGLFHFNVISNPAVLISSSRPLSACPPSQTEDPTLPSDLNQRLLIAVSDMNANCILHCCFAHVNPQLLAKVDISLT